VVESARAAYILLGHRVRGKVSEDEVLIDVDHITAGERKNE
jgi:hypothetical protein